MAKRLQQDSGEERVTAKSRPMMSLIARVPSNVSSSTSVSPVKRSYGNQNPWSTIAEKEEGSGRPDIGIDRKKAFDHYYHEQYMESLSSASYSKWDDDHVWSSQEWKIGSEMYERSGRCDEASWWATRETQFGFSHEETHHDGTAQPVVSEVIPRERPGRPDVDSQGWTWKQFVIGNDEAELELSVESRSFVNRVNDQVQKNRNEFQMLQKMERNILWFGMFMTVTVESAVFMGKNYLNKCQSIANTTDLTLKQMFDISTRLVSEQDEISGLETIGWENHWWKYLSLIGDERVINLQRTKVYVFSDSVLCLGKIFENHPIERWMGTKIGMVKSSSKYRNFDRIDGEPMEFEWNIFSGFNTLRLSEEVKRSLLKLDETPENFTARVIFMSMFNDISCGSKDNEKELCHCAASRNTHANPAWRWICVNTVWKLISLKTEIARSARGPKLQGPHAEDAMAEPYFVLKSLVIWWQQITRSSVTIANLETITDMQSWCRTSPLNGSNLNHAKQKLHRKLKEACKSSWSPIGSLKSFTLTIPWNSAKLVKISPGFIARLPHTDQKQMGLLKKQCAE